MATACTVLERRDTACSIALVCQRCGKCLIHCTCAPAHLRSQDPERTGRDLVKLFTTRRVFPLRRSR